MKRSGFTLIEILVSVGILATIAIVVAQAFFTVIRSNSKTEILKDVKQSGEQAMQTMTRMIQQAQEIASDCSAEGTYLDSVEIVSPDGGRTIFGCGLDGEVTRIASISGTTSYLTDRHVTLGGAACSAASITILCTTTAGVPSRITITFSLAQAGTPIDQFEQADEAFQSSVLIRNERP